MAMTGHPVDPLDKINAALPGRWDWQALRAGATVALFFAVPLTLVAAIVDSDNGGLNALFFFGAMFGFILGGGCAAWVQRAGTPLSHGVVSAAGTYLVAQAVFVAIRLAGGNTVNWFSVFFTLGLVSVVGMFGGVLGNRLQQRGFVPSAARVR
jgi:hypothetical protein